MAGFVLGLSAGLTIALIVWAVLEILYINYRNAMRELIQSFKDELESRKRVTQIFVDAWRESEDRYTKARRRIHELETEGEEWKDA